MNTKDNNFTVMALFNDKDSAERAYDALSERGYNTDEIQT